MLLNIKNLTFRYIKSKSQLFEEKLGGKWEYDNKACWWCDDTRRFIARTATCTCDYSCNCPVTYYLYGDNKSKRLIFSSNKNDFKVKEYEIIL